MLKNYLVDKLIELALLEDIGHGDITTESIFKGNKTSRFYFLAKEEMVLCGTEIVKKVFSSMNSDIETNFYFKDGDKIQQDTYLGEVTGNVSSILTGERAALNFLQRLSGIATNTRRYTTCLKDSDIKILDTRKTTPGHRVLEKYAVKVGGGANHRFGLFDGVLIKDNHIDAAGSISDAVKKAKESIPSTIKIEVEIRNLTELQEAVKAGADIVMLDNFKRDEIIEACKIVNKRAKIELSGGITLEEIGRLKKYDIDYISVGALTHSSGNIDISLKIGEAND
ncbi:MAG: carboxylating nicotinate-nucleotide diphosphorylase [Flexistipes sinusarabici]|uniref:Probable nicotinate-nucleotide pyrophosphorylase [carboxylating] n=1 Tax=Flexistipes sinusarabici TaxID=2352 RepID=A0A5D0MM36_FLESI|nr:carboxylating nicotinate-nucleotide diphosphorylase [Flexistipes sinusarabici]TYB33462.1 MAG: carboxylating nicotinate-nucleotide diphosphorylase [Flexistipes sinusarabici]